MCMYLETLQLIYLLVLTFFFTVFAIRRKLVIFRPFKATLRFAVSVSIFFPDKLSTSFDNEVDICLKLSLKFNFYVIVLPLSKYFLIGT